MAAAAASWPPEDTEICNDDGFVYKRKRREVPPPPDDGEAAPPASAAAERRKAALLRIKERYSAEMEQWESFSVHLDQIRGSGTAGAPPSLPTEAAESPADDFVFRSQIEELLRQVEAQEAMIEKLMDTCDVIDSLCDQHEEATKTQLMVLPVWMTDPRSLVTSLSD